MTAAIEAAKATLTGATTTAYGAIMKARHAADAAWVATVLPAWETYKNDLADHAQTWVATAAPAWETAENAETDAELTYTTAAVPLGVALDAALSSHITTWLGQTVNAEAAYSNALADHAVTRIASISVTKQSLGDATIANAKSYIHSATGADVLLAGAVSQAMVNWAGTVAGQLTGTPYTPLLTTILSTGSTGTTNAQGAASGTAYGATNRAGSNYDYVPDVIENYLIFLNPWSASRPPPVDGWDVAMQRTNKGAIIVGGGAAATAGGLATAGYLGVTGIGAATVGGAGTTGVGATAAIEGALLLDAAGVPIAIAGTAGAAATAAAAAAARQAAAVAAAATAAQKFLGDNYRMLINKAGDRIFMSADGLRKMRFDINATQGDLPHVHLEILQNGKWVDAIPGVHRLYPN